MRVDVPANDAWQRLSASFRKELPFQDDRVQVQVYAGFQHALYEATQGLAKLFSHKKTVAVVGLSAEPAIESTAIDFSEQTYKVLRVSKPELDTTGEWLPKIQAELIFVLGVEDDPVTGRIHDQTQLIQALQDKKIFRISLSHAKHRFETLTRPGPYEVFILSLRADLALLVAGERFRVEPVLAARLAWKSAPAIGELTVASTSEIEKITAFENALPAGFERYFKDGESRVPDRAAIFHPELDGSAVMDELGLIYGLSRTSEDFHNQLDSTSPCRWNQPRFKDWLLKRGESEEIVRGLVLIDAKLIDAGLAAKLETIAANLRKLQLGL